MRRWLAIAALSTAVLAAPLLAQMRGGSRGGMSQGGVSRGGMSTGRSGFSSGGAAGFRGGSSMGVVTRGSFGTGFRQPFSPTRQTFGFRQPFVGPRHFRSSYFYRPYYPYYFGYYGYPAYYGGYAYSTASYYPGYDDYGSSYSTQYYGPSYSVQNDMARQQQDIDRLEDEVARLREQRPSREATSSRPTANNPSEVSTPTLLIFRDKHTQEVQNYAVVGGTLWIFNAQRATKLPLSWLDIEATAKANDDRGVDFQVPR
jgi:hypothetical protein